MPPPSSFKSLQVFDVEYKYLDSGPPPASSNYTTWVFVHGLAFNGAVLEKLLPLAHVHNLRIVSLYRRGYPPSSGFCDAEVAVIGRGKKFDEAEPFFRAQGTEIATFLVNFATSERIPVADFDNPNGGGITLIGWSLGGVHVLMVLAYLDTLLEDTRSTLLKYLHTILPHDVPPGILGIPSTHRVNMKFWSETDERVRFDGLFDFVTAHFIHKSTTSENPDDLEFSIPSPDMPHSLHALPYEQRAEYTHPEAFSFTSFDTKLSSCDTAVFAELTRRALFDKARAEKSPHVRVRFMCGGTTGGVFIKTMWMMRKYAENPPEELYGKDAQRARDIKVAIQTEGNHFVFWDDPEMAIQQYGTTINL